MECQTLGYSQKKRVTEALGKLQQGGGKVNKSLGPAREQPSTAIALEESTQTRALGSRGASHSTSIAWHFSGVKDNERKTTTTTIKTFHQLGQGDMGWDIKN